tara:strand:+ start:139231 stop:140427 length:1197 start_codon:yes stop_codon:yes gene_type:complete
MLEFFSSSARVVNTKRCVNECLEIALGDSNKNNVDLLIFNASIGHDFNDILSETKSLYPNADVVAASCCGIIGKEGVSESMKDMGLMAVKGKDYALAEVDGIFGVNSYEKSVELAKSLKSQKDGINMIYFLASGIDINNSDVINAFESVFGEDVTLFGATSSDNMKGVISYQAVNNNVYENGAYAIGFSDSSLKVHTRATHGFVAHGDPLVVTKSTGHIIHEFNNKPAWQEYTRVLGLDSQASCGDTIPIGALGEELSVDLAQEYGNSHILRVVTKHDGDDMYYTTSCPVNTKLWITVRDENLIFDEMERMTTNMLQDIGDDEIVSVFHADCLARGRFLFNKVFKEELVAKMQNPFYRNGLCPPWLGMYGFGEFARLGGQNRYHNYTTALYVITRSRK